MQRNAILQDALTDQQEFGYGTDEHQAYGAELRTMPWQPPATISRELIEAATDRLVELAYRMDPAKPDKIREWMYELGMVCAVPANVSADDADTKIRILTRLAGDMPAAVFGQTSMQRAVERFKFFPTGNEMLEFLRSERDRLNSHVFRLEQIVKTGERQGPPKWSKELAELHGARLAEQRRQELAALAIVANALPPATPVDMGPSPRAKRASNSLGAAVAAVAADLEAKKLVKEGEVA